MLVPLEQLLEDRLRKNRKSTNINIRNEKDITIEHTNIKNKRVKILQTHLQYNR